MAPIARKPRLSGWRLSRLATPYLFLTPALILFAVFMVYPILSSIWLSLHNPRTPDAGLVLDNYRRLAGDTIFRKAIANTFFLLAFQVPIQLGLALVLAVLLNSGWVRLRSGLRLIYFLPAVTALFAVAIVFRLLLNDEKGLVNYALERIGLQPVPWLLSGLGAKLALIIAVCWRWTGYNMVIYLAGLQSIPDELYEAAAIDGASSWAKFWHITLPLLRPVILMTTVLSTIGTLQIFDEPYLLTNKGGPANQTVTLAVHLYNMAFGFNQEANYGAAIAYAMVLIIMIFSFAQFRIAGRLEER